MNAKQIIEKVLDALKEENRMTVAEFDGYNFCAADTAILETHDKAKIFRLAVIPFPENPQMPLGELSAQ